MPSLTGWVASLVELERLDEAHEIARRLLEFDPDFRLARAESYVGFATPTSQERIANALRQVGLPE